jgi:hypothetical protein
MRKLSQNILVKERIIIVISMCEVSHNLPQKRNKICLRLQYIFICPPELEFWISLYNFLFQAYVS